ncbi:BnaA09g12990D [Brassica napus]|uniref:BnaA09g12990D protein n=1 Tax=Brassica napus TaxID=3708 RepID=A0A078I776_BRANA|nr:BnaA09g12990D [Brassica napus]
MNSNSQKQVSGDLTAKKSNGKAVVSSAEPNSGDLTARKSSGKAVDSSVEPINRAGFTEVSPVSAVPGDPKSKKLNGKAVVSSAVPISGDLTAKKPNGKDVDSSAEPIKRAGHTIISPVPVVSGDPKSKQKTGKAVVSSAEAIRRTGNAGGSCADIVSGKLTQKKLKGKAVDSSSVEVMFFKDVKFGPQEGELRFRLIHFWEARNAHTKILIGIEMILIDEQLVNEQALGDGLVLDEAEIASSRRILVHVQTHDGPVMKLYLWDTAATDFCLKFKAQENTPSVILVTTVNPKRFGGALTISSLSSSRVFLDLDVQPTRDYLAWLGSNSEVANRINAEIVTKAETVTIGELFTYIKQEGSKVYYTKRLYTVNTLALCTATIDDVGHGSAWYYIACGGCKTKVTKGPTTLMCKKCGKAEVAGVAEYLTNLSVYDNNDHARFVLLCDAGHDLTGKLASELVERYFEANESVGDDAVVPVPQALIDTIGQTRTFVVKIKRPNTQQTTIRISIALRISSNGHLDDDTISDMEYMLQYHEINFDSVTEIIDETTNYVAGVILTLDDVTVTDLDVIVKVTDFNPQAWSRIDLDVYTIDLRSNRRESIPSKENDICAICHNELGASGDLNTLVCNHSYHHQCILGWIKMNLTCPVCRTMLA